MAHSRHSLLHSAYNLYLHWTLWKTCFSRFKAVWIRSSFVFEFNENHINMFTDSLTYCARVNSSIFSKSESSSICVPNISKQIMHKLRRRAVCLYLDEFKNNKKISLHPKWRKVVFPCKMTWSFQLVSLLRRCHPVIQNLAIFQTWLSPFLKFWLFLSCYVSSYFSCSRNRHSPCAVRLWLMMPTFHLKKKKENLQRQWELYRSRVWVLTSSESLNERVLQLGREENPLSSIKVSSHGDKR